MFKQPTSGFPPPPLSVGTTTAMFLTAHLLIPSSSTLFMGTTNVLTAHLWIPGSDVKVFL
jgi:hypothetical protein